MKEETRDNKEKLKKMLLLEISLNINSENLVCHSDHKNMFLKMLGKMRSITNFGIERCLHDGYADDYNFIKINNKDTFKITCSNKIIFLPNFRKRTMQGYMITTISSLFKNKEKFGYNDNTFLRSDFKGAVDENGKAIRDSVHKLKIDEKFVNYILLPSLNLLINNYFEFNRLKYQPLTEGEIVELAKFKPKTYFGVTK